jgi:ectoine hydroxylase-related dioxygenase (phytanoyl-CoA dioxygenase family)
MPFIQRLPNDAHLDEVLKALYTDGVVQIKSLIDPTAVDKIKAEIAIQAQGNASDVFSAQTQVICGVAGKSPTAVESILRHTIVKSVREDVLTKKTSSWWGDDRNTGTSEPLLSAFMTSRVGPGSRRQGLHRDDQDHHMTHTGKDPKETSMLFCGVALSKTTRENGATEVVPGSWAWDDMRKPDPSEVCYAEMDIGDCTLMLGNVYHGAGANQTKDEYRHVAICLFCPGIYRTEENQFLAVPRDMVVKYPEDVQDLLGWKASIPYLGWHELDHPFNLFRTDGESLKGLT